VRVRAEWLAVVARVRENVCGERGQIGNDQPDVEVVDALDVRVSRERLADLLDVHRFRSGFEQDATGVSKEAVGGAEHDRGDDQRGDPVGARVPGHEDDRARDRGEDKGGEVGEMCWNDPSMFIDSRFARG
jgi:hypothetical protein